MAVNLMTETIIDALKEGPSYLGAGRNGRPPRKSFVVRAIKKGINGHRLEALRVGSRRVTGVEASQRWAESQTADVLPGPAETPPACRRKAAERAGRELDRFGF